MYAFGEFKTVSDPGSNREKGTPPMKKKNIPASVASTNAYEALEEWARSRSKSGYRSCLRTKSRSFWVGKSQRGVRIDEDTGTVTENRDASQ